MVVRPVLSKDRVPTAVEVSSTIETSLSLSFTRTGRRNSPSTSHTEKVDVDVVLVIHPMWTLESYRLKTGRRVGVRSRVVTKTHGIGRTPLLLLSTDSSKMKGGMDLSTFGGIIKTWTEYLVY